MIYQASEMVKDVRVAIDMNRTNSPLITEGDVDTLHLDEIIYSKLTDAVRIVGMEAPAHMLESGHDFGDNIFIESNGKGFIILPDDFMRIISFRMSDWKRTLYEAIDSDDPIYARQSSRWKGICGNPEKPVCAIARRAEGKVLEFYSCNDDKATVAQATYLPIPTIDSEGGIDISHECYRPAVYRAASLTLASLGDSQAATMLDISKSLLV